MPIWDRIENIARVPFIRKMIPDWAKWKYRRADWEKGYWATQDHPHRDQLMKVLKKIYFNSVLEIGCNCAPNLNRISQVKSYCKLWGIDINKQSIETGRRLLPKAYLLDGDAQAVLKTLHDPFDIVLTDAFLIYIDDNKIESLKKEMLRLAKVAIVLVEWQDDNVTAEGNKSTGHWVRDYRKLFKGYKVEMQKIEHWKDDKWTRFGNIITIKK